MKCEFCGQELEENIIHSQFSMGEEWRCIRIKILIDN